MEIDGGHHPAGVPADPASALVVNETLAIPRSELVTKASRSSGAGGQHVNKTSSRIEISWNIARSGALSDEQREMLMTRLVSRLSTEGAIRVVASEMRSQRQNRDRAEVRLADLVRRALVVRKKRKPTRRPRRADEARLASKKLHSQKKRERKRDNAD
jgi:ribosome-associated protein